MTATAEAKLRQWTEALWRDPDYAALRDHVTPWRRSGGWAFRFIREDSLNALNEFAEFRRAVEAGIFPEPHTLVFIAKCLDDYLERREPSLDKAFGLKPKQGIGSALKQAARNDEANRRHFMMWNYIAKNPGSTQVAAADAVQKQLGLQEPDIDTMVREYRAWKSSLKKRAWKSSLKKNGARWL